MKTSKKLILSATVGLALAGFSHAQTISTETFNSPGTTFFNLDGTSFLWKSVTLNETDLTTSTVDSGAIVVYQSAVVGEALLTGDNDAIINKRGRTIALDDNMSLVSLNAATVTLNYNWAGVANGGATVGLYYSADTTIGGDQKLADLVVPASTAVAWTAGSATATNGVGGVTFTDTARFYFLHEGGTANSNQIAYDNFEITFTAVPEPSSFALLAGMFGLTWVMLRRRK